MNPIIARHCPQCKTYQQISVTDNQDLICPQCQNKWGKVAEIAKIFDLCPCCGARQFYTSKDFNQFVGCLIMIVGIILVPWTYGLSLPVFALIDFFLAKRVPSTIICYRCATEFRNFQTQKKFKPFMHHIGLKYDKYR